MRSHPVPNRRRGASRGGLVVAVAVLGAVAFFGLRGARTDAAPERTLEERYADDVRLRPLLGDCGFGRAFDQDTSDIVEVLAMKLDVGAQREPLTRAKQDLSEMGEEALDPLRRRFDDASRDLWRVAVALNILETCALADEPWGLVIARDAILAQREDVRVKASYVFRKHGAPEDFDLVLQAYRLCETPEAAQKLALALKACDAGRFHYEVVDWIDELRDVTTGLAVTKLADTLAAEAADCLDPVVAERMAARSVGLAPRHRAYLIAPAAATGSREALDELREMLGDELPGPRQHACIALGRAGLVDEVEPVLALDADPRMRGIAAGILTAAPADAERLALFRDKLGDQDEGVRAACLGALVEAGDEAAFAELLRLVEGSMRERDLALRVMRGDWTRFPEGAADRARSRLMQLWERKVADGAPSGELISILSALGAVPGRATGEFLLPLAIELDDSRIRGVDAHRWIVGQAYNAGEESQTLIRERLAVETEPFRRLDLIDFVWQDGHPDALEQLLGILTDEARSPYERLYAADRLTRMGAPERVAPAMKGAYWETTDPVLRAGLQCLLWIWYGPPLER